LLPQSKTKKGFITKHLMVNAILYQLKNGCQWRDLPDNFPNWQTVYSQFRRWRLDGTWEEVLTTLAIMERKKQKKTSIQVYSEEIRCVPKTRIRQTLKPKDIVTTKARMESKETCWWMCWGIRILLNAPRQI
jgi:hypothetical protein